YQGEISPAPPNLVNRNFHAEHPNRLWLTDISVFATNQGRVYLSAIIDCFDGKVVAAKTSVHPTMELAEETLYAAIATEKPA
ncbi:DDE-type integrase/transposase/recombinase, partial [Corynebacterium macclintockiae]